MTHTVQLCAHTVRALHSTQIYSGHHGPLTLKYFVCMENAIDLGPVSTVAPIRVTKENLEG